MKNNITINIKQWLTVIVTASALSACGSGTNSKSQESAKSSLLSGSSASKKQPVKEKFTQLDNKLSNYKSQKQALCSPDEALMQNIQAQLDKIDKNTALSREQKQQAANSVFQNNQSKLLLEKNRMDKCIADNKDAWDSITSQEKPYVENCLPRPPQDGRQGPPGNQSGQRPPPPFGPPDFDSMDSSQLDSFDESLSSSNCSSLLR